jgi:small-conductance mechanosensitive channel
MTLQTIDYIAQIWIIIFGCSAIWFVGRLEKWKRWGYIFGLLSQPAWIYTSIYYNQWGVLILSLWYTYSWIQGVYNYWIKK